MFLAEPPLSGSFLPVEVVPFGFGMPFMHSRWLNAHLQRMNIDLCGSLSSNVTSDANAV